MSQKKKPQQNKLTRIFHQFRDEKVAKADGVRQTKDFDQGCMSTYCPDQNSSLTQHFDSLAPARLAPLGLPSAFDLAPPGARLSDFPAFAVERDEIFGLTRTTNPNVSWQFCCGLQDPTTMLEAKRASNKTLKSNTNGIY